MDLLTHFRITDQAFFSIMTEQDLENLPISVISRHSKPHPAPSIFPCGRQGKASGSSAESGGTIDPPPEDGNERKARGVGRCGKMGAQPQNGAPSLQIEGAGPRIMGFLFNNPKRLPGAPLVAAKGAKAKRSAGNDVARPAQQKGRKRADLLRRKLGCGLCPHRPGKNLGVFARKDLGEL